MIFFSTTSKGCPLRSYIPNRNAGSMTIIISIAAELVPMGFLSKKKSGTPMSAPPPRQRSCLFVRLRSTLLLTFVRSLGTGTYAIDHHLR